MEEATSGDRIMAGWRRQIGGSIFCYLYLIPKLPPLFEGDKPKRQRFKRYPIGFFHIDIAEVQTAEGKLYLFVGIDRTSKFAVTQLVDKADRRTAWEFLDHLLKAVPYRIHTILTDNGIQFADQPRNRNTAWSRQMRFDMICEANDIEHRLTKPNHPWTNGQVERMNRTIKEATVKRFHYESHDQLRIHLADFMDACNFARRLKTLSGLTPYEYIAKIWTAEPHRFIVDPIHQMPGLNSAAGAAALRMDPRKVEKFDQVASTPNDTILLAVRSAIMMVVRLVGAEGMSGSIEASTTRSPRMPRTRPQESTTKAGSESIKGLI